MFWEIMGPSAGGAPTGAVADAINAVVRQLRRVQGAVREGRRRPLRQRLGVADRRRRQAGRSRARANQDSPLMEGKKADPRPRRLGARLLPEVPEPPARLHRRVVERRQLGRGEPAVRTVTRSTDAGPRRSRLTGPVPFSAPSEPSHLHHRPLIHPLDIRRNLEIAIRFARLVMSPDPLNAGTASPPSRRTG